MPYIETYWDYEINKECFKVCGEKGYVHSTDTSLSRADESIDNSLMEYFVIAYDVNVLRDVGTGKIAIYDDGEPITVYSKTTSGGVVSYTAYDFWDWNDQKTVPETIYLQLSYETEHKIQARYLANKNCLPSKSVIDTVQVETPALFSSLLEYTGDVSLDKGTSNTLSFKFTSGNTSYPSDTKTVNVYVDDELITEKEITLSSGVSTFNVTATGLLEGQHSVSAVFEGDTHNESCNCSEIISIGYLITIDEYTKFPIGNSGSITASVVDYLNNPITDYVDLCYGNTILLSSMSDEDGEVVFGYNSLNEIPPNLKVKCRGSSSEQVSVTSVIVNDIDVTFGNSSVYSMAWTAIGHTLDVDIDLDVTDTNGNPVYADGLNVQFNDGVSTKTLTVPTGAQNKLHPTIEGTGAGKRIVQVQCGGHTIILQSVFDYYQAWKASNYEYNQECEIFSHTFEELSTQYKLKVASDGGTARIGFPTHSRDWEIYFSIVSVSAVQMYFRFGNNIDSEFVGTSYLSTFKRGQKIHLVKSSSEGTVKLYVDNSLKKTFTGAVDGKYAYFGIGSGTKGTYMAFDYFRLLLTDGVE